MTEGNIVKFPNKRADDAAFLHCPACEAAEFAIVCRGTDTRPFIAAIVCAKCNDEIVIEGGWLE